MTVTIGRVHVPALRTPFRGVARVYFQHFKSMSFRLVAEKILQLVERPRIDLLTLRFSHSFGTVTNAIQHLYRYRWITRLGGKLHHRLTHPMIHISHKTRFPATQPFQRTTDRPRGLVCLLPLQLGARVIVALTNVFRVTASKEALALAIG